MDKRTFWGVCDIYGREVLSPAMYADLMENPHSPYYYTDKGFAVKKNKKGRFTYLGIFIDEDGKMYQQDKEGNRTYLIDEDNEPEEETD